MISPLLDPSQSLFNALRELRRKMAHFIPSAGVRPKGSYNSTKGAWPITASSKHLVFTNRDNGSRSKSLSKTVSEQAKPALLHEISELLTLLWTLVFEPKHILEMMNHLMNEHG
jgi:hypothetical protein